MFSASKKNVSRADSVFIKLGQKISTPILIALTLQDSTGLLTESISMETKAPMFIESTSISIAIICSYQMGTDT